MLFVAIAVFVVGLVLAAIGLVAGGPDDEARADLRDQTASLEVTLDDTQAELTDAQASSNATTEDVTAFLADAEAILGITADACACSTEVNTKTEQLLAAEQAFDASPSQATYATLQEAIDAVNTELERNRGLLDDLRAAMAARTSIPEPEGSASAEPSD